MKKVLMIMAVVFAGLMPTQARAEDAAVESARGHLMAKSLELDVARKTMEEAEKNLNPAQAACQEAAKRDKSVPAKKITRDNCEPMMRAWAAHILAEKQLKEVMAEVKAALKDLKTAEKIAKAKH